MSFDPNTSRASRDFRAHSKINLNVMKIFARAIQIAPRQPKLILGPNFRVLFPRLWVCVCVFRKLYLLFTFAFSRVSPVFKF